MNKLLISIFCCMVLLPATLSQESATNLNEIRFGVKSHDEVLGWIATGFFEDLRVDKDSTGRLWIQGVVGEDIMQSLAGKLPDHEVTIGDLQQYFSDRFRDRKSHIPLLTSDPPTYTLGSIGGYLSPVEIEQKLDDLHNRHPGLLSEKISLGKSLEGRDIWMVKLSDNPLIDEDEPEVLFEALHHAREPAGMMSMLYTLEYLLWQYGKDPLATTLINEREIYFIPMVNPDGYAYNCEQVPEGGGMWRKNMRRIDGALYGVDLNRNYSYTWGYDETGSSDNPTSPVYRGEYAFSEPETQAIRDFLAQRNIRVAQTIHTYGNVLLYPWGYDIFEPDDYSLYLQWAEDMTEVNQYDYGMSWESLYLANGTADDYYYGEEGIMAFTPELGSAIDRFWPATSRILPIARENLYSMLYSIAVAGPHLAYDGAFLLTGNQNSPPAAGDTLQISFAMQNRGLGALDLWQLQVNTNSPFVSIFPDQKQQTVISARSAVHSDAFTLVLDENIPNGHLIPLTLKTKHKGVGHTYQLNSLIAGIPDTLFSDDGTQGMQQWVTNHSWDTASYYILEGNDPFFTESPYGNYPDELSSYLELANPLAVSSGEGVILNFSTRFDIEARRDEAFVEISINDQPYAPLETDLMRKKSEISSLRNVPHYTGYKSSWVNQIIDLSPYLTASSMDTQDVKIRFRLETDLSINRNGWELDNISILHYRNAASTFELPDTMKACQETGLTLDLPYFAEYLWDDGLTDRIKQVSTGGYHAVTVTDYQGETSEDSTYIMLYPVPEVQISISQGVNPAGYYLDAGNHASYLWSSGDTTRTIYVNPLEYQYLESISIWVEAANDIGCAASDTIHITPLSIENPETSNLHDRFIVVPNPIKNGFRVISAETENRRFKLRLYDPAGRILLHQLAEEGETVFTGNIPSGIYFLSIEDASGTEVHRLVVQSDPY